MIAPIFTICAASPAVRAALGQNPVRLYPFGLIENTSPPVAPYAVWQGFGGYAEQFLDRRPDVDYYNTQIDIYADEVAPLLVVAKALRDAIEPHAYITRWGDQDKDPETKRFRYSFDVSWIVPR